MARLASLARVTLVSTALPLLVMACGSSETGPVGDGTAGTGGSPVRTAGDEALGEPGGPVADVRAEATAVAHHLAEGNLDFATARASFTGRLSAVDFEGQPSFYLVFTTPDAAISDPLGYAADQGPALLAATRSTSTVVGAAEEQPEVAVAESGLSLLFDIGETLVAMGGLRTLDEVVAPLPGIVLLRDRDGTYWDTKTRAGLAASTVEARKKELTEAAAVELEAAKAIAREGWAVRRDGAGVGAPDVSFDTLKTGRGNLDLARALDATLAGVPAETLKLVARNAAQEELAARTDNRQGLWKNETTNCKSWWFFGWHSSCDAVEVGEIANPEKNQAHTPWQGRGYKLPLCFAPSTIDDNASAGCGPAALTALVWAEWKAGGEFASLAALDRSKASPYMKVDAEYQKFTRAMGQAVGNAMGTCSFEDDGSMTLPAGLRTGANAWLAANGSSRRFKVIGGVAGLGVGLDEVAVTLHDRVGLRSLPTAVGFDTGFAQSHWAPVYRYRIVRPAGLGRIQVYIQSLDVQDRWYSLGGIKLLSALAWLE